MAENEKYQMVNLTALASTMQLESQPVITLQVEGRDIEFLCDSGASRTLVRSTAISSDVTSDEYVLVKAANGRIYKEPLSKPLWFTDPETNQTIRFRVIISEICPVHLLGRDLMQVFGIAAVPTSTGMVARRIELNSAMLLEGQGDLHYWYSNDLIETGPQSVVTALTNLALSKYGITNPKVSDPLHCTMYYRRCAGPDLEYEKKFLSFKVTKLVLHSLFWDTLGNSAVTCSLTRDMQLLYKNELTTHISVTEGEGMSWYLVGKKITEWVGWTPEQLAGKGIQVQKLNWVTQARPTVHLREDKPIQSPGTL